MDKRSILGFVLIAIIITVWMFVFPSRKEPVENKTAKTADTLATVDSTKSVDSLKAPETEDSLEAAVTDSLINDSTAYVNVDSLNEVKRGIEEFGEYFYPYTKGDDDTLTIETDKYIAKIRAKGASLIYWELKEYVKWDKVPANLVKPEHKGELFLTFKSRDNIDIDTRDLLFAFSGTDKKHIVLSGDQTYNLTATLKMAEGKEIIRTYTFTGDEYYFDTDISFLNMEDYIKMTGYELMWKDGLKYQEKRSDLESSEGLALVSLNDEAVELDATDKEPVRLESKISGSIDYAAIKTKYFGMAVIPNKEKPFEVTVDFEGYSKPAPNHGIVENYDMYMHMQYKGGEQTRSYKVYIGPLDYDELNKEGLVGMINFGWWLFRLIGEYILMPFFTFLHQFIPNYGLTIIIFSIFIKIVLYPLSVTQMRSAQKMKLVGPELNKVREKYKDDQKRQQQETMKVYSKYGINPAGGCLPMLLQMPILIALWKVFNTTIELRQADFALWISDLSLPDYVIPFPVLGLTHLSGLALLMGITMFIQQKLTLTDPRQKAMVYMMPVMFTLMFSNLPSGLNLYYFMFNLIGIVQQVYINKFSKKKVTLEDLKKAPKKESWLQKKMREAQEIAEAQGRAVPGKDSSSGKTKYQRKKNKKK